MQIKPEKIEQSCPEAEIYQRLLRLDNSDIVELGCGRADITRDIASGGSGRRVFAFEVDEVAHHANLQLTDLPNVTFGLAGAESIPLDDASVDVVLMFKSLHHVPPELMEPAMHEIHRVLKPGGQLYVSEPIFAGDFNEILRLFHDEQQVREAAFNTLQQAVEAGRFELVEETFFNAPMHFEDFADFDNKVINATHTEHRLDEALYQQVKARFAAHQGEDGARFEMPIRVDLLRRPA
ncbi:MAG: class I SAM-dependent methyltransferase [Thiohalophilus sp.]|uniref:class I SAM-dependent methyltransferase n=1 Tax=Thiohalophilus sp. TaxID=3028392 RepID=UPI00286FB217|nr:class I SAM-dependent methyltransferase [Thiohalophilus sp.]MDR9436782.1 class I SAM-dependent methyltransferase [Thiohalophilus sp.]